MSIFQGQTNKLKIKYIAVNFETISNRQIQVKFKIFKK